MANNKYTCKKCSYSFTTDTANASGDDWSAHGKHIHCPNCSAIVAEFLA